MLEGKKILITGASGQCGRGMAFVLSKKNEVHGVARFGNTEVKEELEREGCVTWQMDMGITRPDSLPTDFDVVIHEASSWGKDDTLEDQNRSFHVSCQFVADLMYKNDQAKFALVSTASVYILTEDMCKEDETPVVGSGTYCMEKIAMTQMARWMGHTFGRPWVVLRYSRPFAAYLPHPKVDKILRGGVREANPAAVLERTYVQNHIFNTLKALDYAKPEGEIFNSVTTERITSGEAAQIGAKIAGVEPDPMAFEPGEPPTGPGHRTDTEKLLRLIGPSPVSLEEGLRRYHRAQQENVLTPQDWMFADEEA